MRKLSRRNFVKLMGVIAPGVAVVPDAPMELQAPPGVESYQGMSSLVVQNAGVYQVAFFCELLSNTICNLVIHTSDDGETIVRGRGTVVFGILALDAGVTITVQLTGDDGTQITPIEPRLVAARIL